ncbi:MAG: formylglycine-generating enzyme family protein [Coleofasciculaceae cyanobacterium SM2_1_6]|nr:formylglycine-generating enzyme family protein [Coleofasciculaceae cyanobacterium SM2_1_6]
MLSRTFDFQTVTIDAMGQVINLHQDQAEFFTENLANNITLDMVKIPGGTFQMGSPNTEPEDERVARYLGPLHQVNIKLFYMGKYLVTQEQWQAVMGSNPSFFEGKKLPVESVDIGQIMRFCKKLLQKTGKKYRLPSEAEWEYACRAGTLTPFSFGETITTDLVNYNGVFSYGNACNGVYRKQTTEVGNFPPNNFGLYDMHGNLWEWCSDRWHDNYGGAPTDGSSWKTPTENCWIIHRGTWNDPNDESCWETNTNGTWVMRGGSWFNLAVNCRSGCREWNSFYDGGRCNGFRLALTFSS